MTWKCWLSCDRSQVTVRIEQSLSAESVSSEMDSYTFKCQRQATLLYLSYQAILRFI